MLRLKKLSRWILILMIALVCLNIFIVPCHAELMNMTEEGWIRNPTNNHYYKLTAPMGWLQAEEQTICLGGHLVTINDREEELWLRAQFGANEYFWIGFNDINAEGNWEWISGEPVTYTNWWQLEPNNRGTYGEIEDAAIMNWGGAQNIDGEWIYFYGDGWNDNSIYNKYRGIVEISLAVVFLDKEDPSRCVSGAAADGASQVIIKVIGLPPEVVHPSQVTITIPDGAGQLLLDPPATIQDGVFTQTWKAPEDFGGNDPNPARGRRPLDFQVSINGKSLDVPEFYLYKPPVLLLHGIWSSARAWNPGKDHLIKNYLGGNKYLVEAANYKNTNDRHFAENVKLIGDWINWTVLWAAECAGRQYDDTGIVVKKCDVVAHSMGGILANLYVNSSLYKNDVNRIITIGTPHSGSELANFGLHFLYDEREAPPGIRDFWLGAFDTIKMSLTHGAVEDLQVGSSAILAYREKTGAMVPVYSIVVNHSDGTPDRALRFLYHRFWDWDHTFNSEETYFEDANKPNYSRIYDPLKVEKGLFRGGYCSDFVVSSDSQRGGASISGTTNSKDHMSETNNTSVLQIVVSALNSPVSSFDQDGFSPPITYPVPRVGVHVVPEDVGMSMSYGDSREDQGVGRGLNITSPSNGAAFAPGENIVVTVSCDRVTCGEVHFLSQDLSMGIDDSEPYEFEFTVNNEFLGPMIIVAWVMNENGSIDYDSIEVDIITDEVLEEINTSPSGPLYLRSGEELILCVDGKYQDGIIRDITSLSTTHYASSDPRVVEISSKGVLKARFPGRAVVTIENFGVSTDIDIVVKMVKGAHIGGVAICTEWDYEDPDDPNDTKYAFSFEMITDESVENIVVFTPAIGLFGILKTPQQEIDVPGGFIETNWEYDAEISAYQWDYEGIFDNPNSLDAYGDGNYTIIIQYDDGRLDQKNVWFGIPDTNEPIPQPTREPVFTSFANGDTLTSPVSLKWEACTDPNVNIILVSLEDTDEEMDYIFDVSATGFDEPLPLSNGQWEADLSYVVYYQTETIDGIEVFCCKYSQSDYTFAVP